MTPDNFDAIVTRLLTRTPFRPFTVELVSGSRFEIDGPGAAAVRDGAGVFIAPGNIPVWFDHESVSHIIEETAQASP